MGLSESGCTMFTCRAGMCKHNIISDISGREQDRLTVHLWFCVYVCVCVNGESETFSMTVTRPGVVQTLPPVGEIQPTM